MPLSPAKSSHTRNTISEHQPNRFTQFELRLVLKCKSRAGLDFCVLRNLRLRVVGGHFLLAGLSTSSHHAVWACLFQLAVRLESRTVSSFLDVTSFAARSQRRPTARKRLARPAAGRAGRFEYQERADNKRTPAGQSKLGRICLCSLS